MPGKDKPTAPPTPSPEAPAAPGKAKPEAKPPAAPPESDAPGDGKPKADKDALALLLKSLENKAPQLKVGLADILYADEKRTQTVQVPSAIERDGKELVVDVVVRDIGDRGLMSAYSEAMRRSPDEAHVMLWEKCVVEPAELSDREHLLGNKDDAESKPLFLLLPSRFKEGLSVRILRANGVEGFLEQMSLL